MTLYQAGQINTTALIVPDLYVQIVSPQTLNLNGVPTDIIGLVGSSSWGPVGQPVVCGDGGDYAAAFGPIVARAYDMGTHLAIACQQGAQNFRCVRVTDTTDTKTAATFLTSLTLTALYTGSLGNSLFISISAGSAAATTRVTLNLPGFAPEVFDNIAGTGATLWTNVASVINNGTGSPQRGKSNLVTATATGGTTAAPTTLTTYYFQAGTGVTAVTAGTDGASGVTDTMMMGIDTIPRTGMYALRSQGCGMIDLCDVTTYADFVLQGQFGQQEGAYMICADPAGSVLSPTGIATAITNKQNAGLDNYAVKLTFGDWIWWADAVNGVNRLVSPQAFVAGRLANLSPEQSSLNKPLYGVLASQKSGLPGSGQVLTYADADLGALFSAGFDVISNPQPGGSYWGVRNGHNSSSNASISGDNYTRMTNYISETLSSGMGIYVGEVVNTRLFLEITATINSYLAGLVSQGLLAPNSDGSSPYKVICNAGNNPQSRTSLGYVQADVAITYQSINEKFIINVQGGATVVTKASQSAPAS